jgi:hypothetical protein
MNVIEVTTRIGCPVACRYCPQAELRDAYRRRGGPDMLSPDRFRACLERIPAGVAIHFSGMGEPWSNPDCTAMVLDARARGFAVMVSTTLAGMTPEDAARLQGVPIAELNIHLPSDGSGGETIRVDQDYLDLLSRLLSGPLNVRLRYLGERPHPRVSALLAERDLQHVSMHTRAGNRPLEDVPAPGRRRGRLGCQRGFRQGVLLPNGEVALCCMDYGLRHVLGSLLHTGYEELFAGAAFAEIRAGRRDESRDILCRSCDAFAYRANPVSDLYYRALKPRLLKIRERRGERR